MRGFRQFSALTKCHARHAICTLSPLDAALTMRFAENTQHDTSKVLRLPREMTMEVAKVLRHNSSSENVAKVLCLPHKSFDTLRNRSECHELSATPATRNEATRRWKRPKVTSFAELAIGTAIRPSHGHLRTVADGCERLRNVERTRTHPQPPDPQSETRTLATHSGTI